MPSEKSYLLGVELLQAVDRRLIHKGNLKIKKIDHTVRYYDSPESKHAKQLSLTQIFTTKKNHVHWDKEQKLIFESQLFHSSTITFDKPQYHTMSMVHPSVIDPVEKIKKLDTLLLKHDVILNICMSAFTPYKRIQIFQKDGLEIKELNDDLFLCKSLIAPDVFGGLNSNSKFVLDAMENFEKKLDPSEKGTIQRVLSDFSLMKNFDFWRLLTTSDEKGILGILGETVFKFYE